MGEPGKRGLLGERNLHLLFELTLGFKAVFALAEIVAGVATYLVPQRYFLALALWVTRDEFAEDPHDLLANFLLHTVQHLSVDAQRFAGLYLLAHGVIKLWLVAGLLRERLWYFPVSLVVFALFIAYQAYRFTYTHSVWLLLVTALDIIVIALTWHEYTYLRSQRSAA
ncbi:DUF2127 domain-containing protein [Paraburkholderia nodosa]|uniref:DUF2127 domain-containing protein n=1 Tax=Paraburkholderia nodosa TaxID=392320 RepID=UPI0004859545|nr:DUF2127 domain-containing protein [Paraburkholderia nodosa]